MGVFSPGTALGKEGCEMNPGYIFGVLLQCSRDADKQADAKVSLAKTDETEVLSDRAFAHDP